MQNNIMTITKYIHGIIISILIILTHNTCFYLYLLQSYDA